MVQDSRQVKMQRIANRVSRRTFFCSVGSSNSGSTHYLTAKQCYSTKILQRHVGKLQKPTIPGDFMKWSALGFYRTSKFAAGFTPLQLKPLGSIIDMQRAKDKEPEELVNIWDDVRFSWFASDFISFATCFFLSP